MLSGVLPTTAAVNVDVADVPLLKLCGTASDEFEDDVRADGVGEED